jgi:hypothetical protein
MYVFQNGVSSSTKEGSVSLCKRYVCCTAVSARVYLRYHGVQVTMDGQSVKLQLAFASTVIHGFSLLKIHDQDLYSLLDLYMFLNGRFVAL